MAARNIDLKYSTFAGTSEQLERLLSVLAAGASNVDAKFCNFVLLDKPADEKLIATALATTPRKQSTRA